MGTIELSIPDELEEAIRREVALRRGTGDGAFSGAVMEALQMRVHSSTPLDSSKYRRQFPGKYVLVSSSGEVLGVLDTIDEVFRLVAETDERVVLVQPELGEEI